MRRVLVYYPDLDRRGRAVVRDALVLEEFPDARRLDLPETYVRPRDGRHGPRKRPSVAVEHGEGPQVPCLVAHPDLDSVAQCAQIRPPVRVHHALRTPRGTRRVVDGDGFFFVFQHVGRGFRRAFGQVVRVWVSLLPGVVDAHGLDTVDVSEQPFQFGVHEDGLRARVLDDVGDLILAETGVDGDEHEPCGGYGEVGLQHGRRVGAEEGDAVALLQTGVPQPRGQTVDPLLEFAVGVTPPTVDDGGLLGKHVGAAPEEADRCKLAAIDFLAHESLLCSLPNRVYRSRLRPCHVGPVNLAALCPYVRLKTSLRRAKQLISTLVVASE